MTTKITTEEQYTTALARFRDVVRLCDERRAAVDRMAAIERRTVQDLELATLVAERSMLSNAIALYAAGVTAPEGLDGPVVAVSAARCCDCHRPITKQATVSRAPIAGRWQWVFVICGDCHARSATLGARP